MKCGPLSILACAVMAVFLASCAPTPTRYQKLDYTGGGYQDFPVNTEEFVVEFRGNGVTDQGTVKDYAFYRCAEMAKEKGFETFEVVGMTEAPYTPPLPPGSNGAANKPLPGFILQIRCSKNPTASGVKVYKVAEIMAQVGPNVVRQ